MNQNDGFLAEKLKVQSNWHGIHTFRNCQLKIRFDLVVSDQYCDSECALNWYPSTGTGLLLLALSTFGKVNVLLFNGCRNFFVNSYKVHTNLKFHEMATIAFSRVDVWNSFTCLGPTNWKFLLNSAFLWEYESLILIFHFRIHMVIISSLIFGIDSTTFMCVLPHSYIHDISPLLGFRTKL